MLTKQVNAKDKLLQDIWKKALVEGELVMPLEDDLAVYKFRMALYSAVKQARKGLGGDLELISAAQNCVLQVRGTTIKLSRAANNEDVQKWAKLAGMELDGRTEEEKQIEESARAMAKKFGVA